MRRITVAAATSMVASVAFAINTSVFLDAPVTRLSAEELETFRAFVEKTLDESPDGKMVEWRAPKTRFVSKLTPGKSFTEEGRKCREMTIESDSHDRYQRGRYLFCRIGAGLWEFSLPKARPEGKQK